MKIKFIKGKYLSIVLLCIVSFSAFTQVNAKYIKQLQDSNGRIIFFQYENEKLIKIISTLDGLREGVTEEFKGDSISGEFLRIVSFFEKGVLKEECFYTNDSILMDKYVYNNGKIIYSLKLINIDNNNLHYIMKKFKSCNFMQYRLLNDVVIDSMDVKM